MKTCVEVKESARLGPVDVVRGRAPKRPLFELGQIMVTESLLAHLDQETIDFTLVEHQSGRWGDVHDVELLHNARALAQGGYLFSAYFTRGGIRFWVVTDGDRSRTVLMLPEDQEYDSVSVQAAL